MKTFLLLMMSLIIMPLTAFAEPPTLKSKPQYQIDAHQICVKEWTKRGELDRSMYNYCIKQQTESYYELLVIHDEFSEHSFYSEISYPHCLGEWSKRDVVDTKMLVYCLEKEIEGVKDIIYYRKKYGQERVDNIASKAIADFNSWSMASYMVKREIE